MLSLVPTDDLAQPAFKDAASCTQWLSQLQLTNLNLAHSTLRKQLDELNRYPLKGIERLHILEVLRETIALVQSDMGRKLAGKKLPLADDEFILLLSISNLWQGMLNGYLRCLQSAAAFDTSLAAEGARLCERAMYYSGLRLSNFMRAGCEPDAKSWQQFHTLYAYIEAAGAHKEKVDDTYAFPGHPPSARALYASTLLMHRARLQGLSRTQWRVAENLLVAWGDALSVESRCSISREDAPPLGVDLAGTQGLQSVQAGHAAPSMRYLAMVPLSKLIRVKTILLQQGQTPQQVDLGSEFSGKEMINMLQQLHACWCEAHPNSLADTPYATTTRLCIGMEHIYARIAGKPFKPIKDASKSLQDAQRQIETFGRVLDDTGRHALKELGFVPEEWHIEEDTLLRARLLRQANVGKRLAPQQLLSVCAPDGTLQKIGVTTLTHVTRTGHLYIGLRYLPGQAQAVIVRGNPVGELLQSGQAPALILPAMEKLGIPASLVLPREWFKPGRTLEISLPNRNTQNVTLGFSVEKGNDFERVSFGTPAL